MVKGDKYPLLTQCPAAAWLLWDAEVGTWIPVLAQMAKQLRFGLPITYNFP